MQEKQDDIVYISSEINEIFSTTEVKQSFTNELENPIELSISFPIIERLTLSKFIVTIDDKTIISKVLAKEKAEEKYNDSVSSGNVGFISRYEENYKTYSVNIGNLQPKKKIKLTSVFIEMIDTTDFKEIQTIRLFASVLEECFEIVCGLNDTPIELWEWSKKYLLMMEKGQKFGNLYEKSIAAAKCCGDEIAKNLEEEYNTWKIDKRIK